MTATDPRPRALVEVQYARSERELPEAAVLERWAQAALTGVDEPVELVIRIVDADESRSLNHRYRGKDSPTNVLSFPFEAPPGVDCRHIGDLVVCAPVVAQQAAEQRKPLHHHWAHMIVHGVLHLRGYDHCDERQAREMEALEKQILEGFGIPDPYRVPA